MKEKYNIHSLNWRHLVFTSFILASKIWDDESYENENFSKAFAKYSIRDINCFEMHFLECIDFELYIKSSDYAKHYYILRVKILFSHLQTRIKKVFPLDL